MYVRTKVHLGMKADWQWLHCQMESIKQIPLALIWGCLTLYIIAADKSTPPAKESGL